MLDKVIIIGSLSSDVFERRTSTGSEPFSILNCLDATKFVLLRVFTLIETISANICLKSRLKSAKVHVRLTCVTQKRRSLNSLITGLTNGRTDGRMGNNDNVSVKSKLQHPPGHTPGIWHLCRSGEEGIWLSESSGEWGNWSPCVSGGEFELHPRFHVKSLAWWGIMGDTVLEDFRGKDCAFAANW